MWVWVFFCWVSLMKCLCFRVSSYFLLIRVSWLILLLYSMVVMCLVIL